MGAISQIRAEELFRIVEGHQKIIIYGAGILGQGLYYALKRLKKENNVVGFAVSNHTDHLNEYMGIPIRYISEYEGEDVHVLVAVKHQYVEGIISNLDKFRYDYVGIETLKTIFADEHMGIDGTLKNRMLTLDLSDEQYVTFCIRQIRRTRLDFEVNIVDHCNLNCQCCNHFSPIAKPTFIDVEALGEDLERIKLLTGGDVGRIWLIGGEPLLHPEIVSVLYIARKVFPETHITLDTNGILLPKQTEDFWRALRETNIELTLTKYPVPVDYDAINEIMDKENVTYAYTLSSAVLKTTYHLPLNLQGALDGCANYIKCWHANECVTLRDGRIYTCPIAAHAHHFNKYFNEQLSEAKENSISIYEVDSIDEVLEFLKHPIPFCKHCNIDGYKYDLKWDTSKRDIREWT